MSLIRCPGCKLDTSDSLEHCPYCGAGLNGRPARTIEAQPGPIRSAEFGAPTPSSWLPSPPTVRTSTAHGPAVKAPSQLLRTVLGLVALVVFFVVPGGPAIVILGAVIYAVLKAKGAVSPAQVEALRRFAEQARANRAEGRPASERPLDMLRQIEAQIREGRQRDRA